MRHWTHGSRTAPLSAPHPYSVECRVQGVGCRVQALKIRVWGFPSRASTSDIRGTTSSEEGSYVRRIDVCITQL